MLKKQLKISLLASVIFLGACGNNQKSTEENGDANKTETTTEQNDKSKRISPLVNTSGQIAQVNIAVVYSQPSVRGRVIWGDLVSYDEVWRTGANEATTISFDKDVLIEGKKVPAGKYSLFTIPTQGDWTLIINKVAQQWGAYEYDEQQDALRVKVKPQPTEMTEKMTFSLTADQLELAWEKVKIGVKVEAVK